MSKHKGKNMKLFDEFLESGDKLWCMELSCKETAEIRAICLLYTKRYHEEDYGNIKIARRNNRVYLKRL